MIQSDYVDHIYPTELDAQSTTDTARSALCLNEHI